MSSILYTRLDGLTDKLIETAVAIFVHLMQNDLCALSLCDDDVSLMPAMIRATICALSLDGECYGAFNSDHELVGYTFWMPPGKDLFSTEEQRNLGLTEFMKKLSPAGMEVYKETFAKVVPQFVASYFGPTGRRDSWWCHLAMVRKDYQGKGIAKALFRFVIGEAATTRKRIGLTTTTDSNVPVYEGLGFNLKGTITVSTPNGSWPLHLFSIEPSNPEGAA